MAKPDGIAPEAKTEDVSWGTWEELLLAFAVNRHGNGAWDSIATELQKRASDPNMSVTAQACRLKYIDLKRRFVSPNEDDEDDGSDDKSSVTAPLLEELRKLRVAELRREVQRYDLNIESLEVKVKRMEEERERTDNNKTSPDPPEKSGEEHETTAARDVKPDQLSANESNSTDLKAEKLKASAKGSEPAGEETREATTGQSSAEPDELKSDTDRKPVREESCNGSSNSIDKELDRKGKGEPASESVESDGREEEEGNKESSDVQSSASRSRKDEDVIDGGDKVRRGCTTGDDEDQSLAAVLESDLSAETQPLVEFLRTVRGHRLGSVFSCRLRSQESSRYQKMILQHVDLETIVTRLKDGWYSGSATKFFRDLLLLVNNALVYFPKSSPEANAATELHKVISKEVSQRFPRPEPSSGKEVSLQSVSKQKKEEPEPLILTPRIPGSLIVCRKRSSIAAKADKSKEQTEDKETKPVEEPKITKRRTSDRFPPVTAGSKKNGKKNAEVESKSEAKIEGKKNQSTSLDSKKRGAANFLNRMKQGSSLNNGALLDALKNTPLTSDSSSGKGGGSSGAKKTNSGKKKEVASNITRRSTETRQAKEKGSPGKRNVGRPPKRGAAQPPLGKRGRGETETPPSKQQPKKRSRKL